MPDIQILDEIKALKAHSEGIVLMSEALESEDKDNDIYHAAADLAKRLEKLYWELRDRLIAKPSAQKEDSSNG